MLTDYSRSSETLERMRASCVAPYLDDLASTMARAGFEALTIVEHLRTVVQIARWAERRGIKLAHWDDSLLAGFNRHLARRKLAKRHRVLTQAVQFLAFLRTRGVIAPVTPPPAPRSAPLLESFASWMLRHRGVTSHTLYRYRRLLEVFVAALGEDPVLSGKPSLTLKLPPGGSS